MAIEELADAKHLMVTRVSHILPSTHEQGLAGNGVKENIRATAAALRFIGFVWTSEIIHYRAFEASDVMIGR